MRAGTLPAEPDVAVGEGVLVARAGVTVLPTVGVSVLVPRVVGVGVLVPPAAGVGVLVPRVVGVGVCVGRGTVAMLVAVAVGEGCESGWLATGVSVGTSVAIAGNGTST